MLSRIAFPRVWLIAVIPVPSLIGCDGGTPLARDRAPSALAQPESVPAIELVLPSHDSMVFDLWARAAQAEAGQARVIFNVTRPELLDPPDRQAELIREAIDRGVAAVIVVPVKSEALSTALSEARDRGVVVVALGEEIEMPGEALPLVMGTPLDESSNAMVGKLMEDAERTGLRTDGPAQIVIGGSFDQALTNVRAEALRRALEASGIRVLPDVHLDDPNAYLRRIGQLLEVEDPPIMILATDEQSLGAAIQHRAEMKPENQPRMLIAGFADSPGTLDAVAYGLLNSGTDTRLGRPAVEAVRLVLDGIRGEPLPERLVIPAPVRMADGPLRGDEYPALRNFPPDIRPRSGASDSGG